MASTAATSKAPRTGESGAQSGGPEGEEFLDKEQALQILGVKAQTLYAYVSRGVIRSASATDRTRRYHREDVLNFAARSRNGSSAQGAKAPPLMGAGASLPTSISRPDRSGPLYRSMNAITLAQEGRSFEQVSELLWTGELPGTPPAWPRPRVTESFQQLASLLPGMPLTGIRPMLALTIETFRAEVDEARTGAEGAELALARQLVQLMAPSFGLLRAPPTYPLPTTDRSSIAEVIAAASGLPATSEVLASLNCCLVLAADNGLATSTLAARVAASSGADLFSCVTTALGAFDGEQTGSDCDLAEGLLAQTGSTEEYLAQLRLQRVRKQTPAGYDSNDYPDGDARTEHLLGIASTLASGTAQVTPLIGKVRAAEAELGLRPGLAIGLAAIARALRMPMRSPGLLMAVGRSAGWIAHVLEQRLSRYVMRPQSHYTGR